jgi:hypothetical protein
MSEFIEKIREGNGASGAENGSWFLHTFLKMLLHICKVREVRREIRKGRWVNSEFEKVKMWKLRKRENSQTEGCLSVAVPEVMSIRPRLVYWLSSLSFRFQVFRRTASFLSFLLQVLWRTTSSLSFSQNGFFFCFAKQYWSECCAWCTTRDLAPFVPISKRSSHDYWLCDAGWCNCCIGFLEASLHHVIESYWRIGLMLKPLMTLWHSVFRVLLLFQIWLNVCRFDGMRFNRYEIKFWSCIDCSWILGEGTEFYSKKIKSSRNL